MKLGWRLLAAMAVGFLLVPAVHADDAEKAVKTAKANKDEAVNSPVIPDAAGEATPAVPTPAPLPRIKLGRRSGTPRVDLSAGYSFWRAVPIGA
jgi:hypothetical protein